METVLFAHELTRTSQTPLVPAPPDRAETFNALLAKLGDDSFETREKATMELIRKGPAIKTDLEKAEKDTTDPEVRLRCRQILAALEDVDQTAVGVLEFIEKSEETFLRLGRYRTTYNGPRFSAHLRGKALLAGFSLTGSANKFIEQIASTSSLHGGTYRVRFPDGSETDLKAWLSQKFKSR